MDQEMMRNGLFGDIRGVRRGWAIQAVVYVAVNLMLATLALLHGRAPVLVPALAWGVGLAIHGTVAFLVGGRRVRRVQP
jgi:hypothetical protein